MKKDNAIKKSIDKENLQAWELMTHDPVKALEISVVVHDKALKNAYQKGIADSLLNMGWCRKYTSELELSLYNIMDALSAYQNAGDSQGVAKALNAVGAVYFDLGNLDSALDFFNKSLSKSRETKDNRREIAALNNIGEVYREQGKMDEALSFYSEGLALAEKADDAETMGNLLLGMGIVYMDIDNFDKAVEFLSRARVCCDKASDKITGAHCITNLGKLYYKKGELDRSEELYRESLEISRSTGNRREEAEILNQLGVLRYEAGDSPGALEFYEEALNFGKAIKARPVVLQSLESISRIYEERGDFQIALQRFREFHTIESELAQDEAERRFQKLAVRYEIERSREEAELFKKQNEELELTSEELRKANQRISVIGRIGRQITALLKLDDVLLMVYEQVKHLMTVNSLGLARYDSQKACINYLFFIEGKTRYEPFTLKVNDKYSLGAWCIRHQEEVFINDPEEDSGRYVVRIGKHVVGKPSGSIMYVPLFFEGTIIGLITVQAQSKNAYTRDDLEVLRSLGSYISIAVSNSLAHQEIRELNQLVLREKGELEKAYGKISHMAHHDNLTGLPNRRLLLEFLNKALAQANRQDEKLAVLYIDLDNFKPVNDTMGHAAGDLLLRMVADRFLEAFRKSDTVARIGGDEFAAVVVGVTSMNAVNRVIQKIHQSMERVFTIEGREFRIGVSIGTSLFPEDGKTPDELLMVADKMMYLNKIGIKEKA